VADQDNFLQIERVDELGLVAVGEQRKPVRSAGSHGATKKAGRSSERAKKAS
jgi:hypothetical protein